MRLRAPLVVGFALAVVCTTIAWPCRCRSELLRIQAVLEGRDSLILPSLEELRSKQVFLGSVILVETPLGPDADGDHSPEREKLALLEVQRFWFGNPGPTRWVATPAFVSACGIDFKVGQQYFVVAEPAEWEGQLPSGEHASVVRTDRCLTFHVQPADSSRIIEHLDAMATPWLPPPREKEP